MTRALTLKQRGQSMVEFAMVLPLLLIVSVGTLELGTYLQRRIILDGATFVAARAAAVQGSRAPGVVHQVLHTYAQDARAPWIDQAASTAKVAADSTGLVGVSVTRQRDVWSGLFTASVALLGGKLQPLSRWTATAPVNQEFVLGDTAAKSAAQEPTDRMIDYAISMPWQGALAGLGQFGGLLSGLPGNVGSMAGGDLLVAANPAEQAVAANPYDRHMNGNTSPSKLYVSPRYEDTDTTHAGMLETGLPKLTAFAQAIEIADTAPGNPVQPAVAAVTMAIAQVDRVADFDKQAQAIEDVEQKIFGLP